MKSNTIRSHKHILLSFFMLFSLWGSAQALSTSSAMPNPVQQRLINESIEVSYYKKETLSNYARFCLAIKNKLGYNIEKIKTK